MIDPNAVIVIYVEGYVCLGWGAGTHTVTSQLLGVPTTRTMAAPLHIQSPLLRSHAAPTEAVYRSMGYPGKEVMSTHNFGAMLFDLSSVVIWV